MQSTKPKHAFVHALLPWAIQPAWLLVRARRWFRHVIRRNRQTKRVLLICHNPVAAAHLVAVVDLLRDQANVDLYVANDHFPEQEISKFEIKRFVKARYRPILLCLLEDWDLAVYVNHAWGFGAWIAPIVRKVYINHGLYVGKINNQLGEDGVYGKHRTTRAHRGLLYDRMFAASQCERENALVADPTLADVVVVTGSLVADRILTAYRERQRIRSLLGMGDSRRLIHVISTWGKHSLVATMGNELLDALERCGRIGDVLLSLHPRLDKFGGIQQSREQILRTWASHGATVDEANERWVDFVAASDVALTDHSSLALYQCMLRRPVACVPVDPSGYLEDSPFAEVQSQALRLDSADKLSDVLDGLERGEGVVTPATIERLITHLGDAATQHLNEFGCLLQPRAH